MDGNTLQQLFAGPNPFLAQMGEKAFNLDQQKKQADLQSIVGAESRAREMLPFQQRAQEANIRQSDAAAGYSTVMKNQLADQLSVLQQVPMSDRVNAHIAKMKSELTGEALKQTDAEMEGLLGAAATAMKNGGTLPLGYTLQNPQHLEYFKSPKGAALASQIARAYFMQKPKEMYAETDDARDTSRALEVARVGAAARAAGAKTPTMKFPKNPREAYTQYAMMAAQAEDPTQKAEYERLAQEQWKMVEQEIALKAQASVGGKLDLGATIQSGQPQTFPVPGRSQNSPGSSPDNPIKLK